MKKIYYFFLGAAFITSCSSNPSSSVSDSTKTDTQTESASIKDKPQAEANWTMQSDTDKMTSKQRYFATVTAKNKLDFDAPYDGGSTATIMLRNQSKTNDVMLEIDKGQFICDISDGCAINVRFDNKPAMKFNGSAPSDGSSTLLFISPEKKFISNLKKAKKMIVQAEFYQSGLKTMEFDVDGLKWDH